MEFLEYKEFGSEDELCQWVNENRVTAVAITKRATYFVLFYKIKLD